VSDTDVTEITELEATKVAGVASPANGTPFLLLKAAEDAKEDCPTCKGKGTILEGNRKCPDCKGSGEQAAKSDSAEADAEEEEVTESKAEKKIAAWQDAAKEEAAEWEALDKALSDSDREKMPASSFAFIDKNGKRHLPVHDEGHVKSALGRFNQQDFSEAKGDPADAKKKAAAKILSAAKTHGIEVDAKANVSEAAKKAIEELEALAKSPGVPDESVQEPKVAGHLDSGKSGLSGSLAVGTATPPSDSALTLGGKTTANISALEAKVTNTPTAGLQGVTDGAGIINPQAMAKGVAVASLFAAMEQIEQQRELAKTGGFMEATGDAALTPGSMPWESYDAATLKQIAECLANCCNALDHMASREREEGVVANTGDMANAWDLEEAGTALDYALGVVARLSFHEAVESEAAKSAADESVAKVGRKLSGKTADALRAARDHLNAVIDGADNDDQAGDAGSTEEQEMALTVTKDELGELVVKSVKAVIEEEKAAKKAKKKAAAEEAAKNANNGGDISEADIKPTSEHDAYDIQAVGSSVDPTFVNKGAADGEGDETFTKQVAGQLETLTKGLSDVQEMVTRFAKRPRSGGPSLDGQPRGLAPALEGRLGDATKGVDDGELEALQKSFDEATDPRQKEQAGEVLTKARLVREIMAGKYGVPR
jgi:hypothetical protein